MRQQRFAFSPRTPRVVVGDPTWPVIIASNPDRYPGLLQKCAAMALHRLDRPHATELCLLCEREKARAAA